MSAIGAVQGRAAHDSAAEGNPVLVGGMASTALPAAVANADVAHLITDVYGRLLTAPYASPENWASGRSAKIEDTNAANVLETDSGADLKWYVCTIMVTNSDATVGTLVTIQDDAGSPTVIWQGYAAPAGGGFVVNLNPPIPTAADAHIHAICGTTSAEVYACVSAFKAP
jgi:hypothetical protein